MRKKKRGRFVGTSSNMVGFLSSGATYDNRFISVIRIENRKIIHWRDYMDSLASWTALNSGSPRRFATKAKLSKSAKARWANVKKAVS
jgi:hypothetical protein